MISYPRRRSMRNRKGAATRTRPCHRHPSTSWVGGGTSASRPASCAWLVKGLVTSFVSLRGMAPLPTRTRSRSRIIPRGALPGKASRLERKRGRLGECRDLVYLPAPAALPPAAAPPAVGLAGIAPPPGPGGIATVPRPLEAFPSGGPVVTDQ